MNIESLHPILVHFPIALLSIYAILECIRFKKFEIKAFLVILGSVASLAALASGPEGSAARAWTGFSPSQAFNLVETHSTCAGITTIVFAVLALSYIIMLLGKKYSVPAFILKIGSFVQKTWVAVPLASIGLIAVLLTGGLGGAIVYGPDIDPFVSVIYHLFF
jgi:uncharacterized membrane protein